MRLAKINASFFLAVILFLFVVPFNLVLAQKEATVIIGSPNDYLVKGNSLVQNSSNYEVTWTLLQEFPYSVMIEIENLGVIPKAVELSSLLSGLSVPLDAVDVTGFYEWKNVSRLVPRKVFENFVEYDSENNTVIDEVVVPTHFEYKMEWVGVLPNKRSVIDGLGYRFNVVNLPAKAEGGFGKRTFRLDFKVPMGSNIDGSFGCSGELSLKIENEIFHPWFNTSWSYRKFHNITHSSGAGTNYPIGFLFYYGSGTDGYTDYDSHSVGKAYLDEHCQTDFDDVRFTDDDEETVLDYWIEYVNAGSYAEMWVEVADDLSTDDTCIWVYYGNDDVDDASDGDATFIFFDDFDNLDDWDDVGGGNWCYDEELGETYMVSSSGDDDYLYPSSSVTLADCRFRSRMRFNSTSSCMVSLCTRWYTSSHFYRTGAWSMYYHTVEQWKRISGSWTSLDDDSATHDTAWTLFESQNVGTSLKCFEDNGLQLSNTDSDLTGAWNVAFRRGFNGYATCYYCDWCYVAKKISSEPVHTTWGEEEEYVVPTATPTPTPTEEEEGFLSGFAVALVVVGCLGVIVVFVVVSPKRRLE